MIRDWMKQNIAEMEIKLTAHDIEKILNDLSTEDLQNIIIEVLENNSKLYVGIRSYVMQVEDK